MTRRLLCFASALGVACASLGCNEANTNTTATVPKFDETKTPATPQPAKKSASKNGFE